MKHIGKSVTHIPAKLHHFTIASFFQFFFAPADTDTDTKCINDQIATRFTLDGKCFRNGRGKVKD